MPALPDQIAAVVARATQEVVRLVHASLARTLHGRGGVPTLATLPLGRKTPADRQRIARAAVEACAAAEGGLQFATLVGALGCTDRELPAPLREAVAAGWLKMTGEKRTCRYFATAAGRKWIATPLAQGQGGETAAKPEAPAGTEPTQAARQPTAKKAKKAKKAKAAAGKPRQKAQGKKRQNTTKPGPRTARKGPAQARRTPAAPPPRASRRRAAAASAHEPPSPAAAAVG